MSDEVSAEVEPRRRWLPQTVRVRLTIVATLAFAITLSAAAFGLVKLVRNDLVDRIQETNQAQLDQLQERVHRGELIVHRDHARRVLVVLGKLFEAGYPIQRLKVVDAYRADDDRSMARPNACSDQLLDPDTRRQLNPEVLLAAIERSSSAR